MGAGHRIPRYGNHSQAGRNPRCICEDLLQAKAAPVTASSNADQIINLILKAVPLAMGVAVIVTSVLGELDMKSGFTMLGVGLACIGAYLLKQKD